MQTETNLPNENGFSKPLMLFITLLTLLLGASCEKEELRSEIGFRLAIGYDFDTKAKGMACRDSQPVKLVMVTDKGVFETNAWKDGFDIFTGTVSMEPGKYEIYAFYTEGIEGEMLQTAHIGRPDNSKGGIIGNWIEKGWKYDFTKSGDFSMLLFCK